MQPTRVTLHQSRPGIIPDSARIYYGDRFSGRFFDHIEMVDGPANPTDWDWMRDHLAPRLAPGATICGRIACR